MVIDLLDLFNSNIYFGMFANLPDSVIFIGLSLYVLLELSAKCSYLKR